VTYYRAMHLIPCALNIGQFTTVYRYGALSMSLKLWPAKCQSNQWHVLLVPKTSLTSQHCKHSAKQLIHSKNKTESAVSIPFTTKTHNRTCTHQSRGNRTVTMKTSTNGAEYITTCAYSLFWLLTFGVLFSGVRIRLSIWLGGQLRTRICTSIQCHHGLCTNNKVLQQA